MDKNLNNLFVISSPSGGGKSSLIEALLSEPNAQNLSLSISFTTRLKRSTEEDGKNYYFIDRKEFEKKINNNDFLEYAEVFNNFYGTERQQTEKIIKSKDLLLELDWQGAFNIKEKFIEISDFLMISLRQTEVAQKILLQGHQS